jgi:hypothetical protein
MKNLIEGKVVAYEDKQDPKNPQIVGVVVIENKTKITATLEGTLYVKMKSLVKPSKIGEVLRFEVEIFSINNGFGVNTYYRIIREVK